LLSPSTADTDRREKATAYASTGSLDVLLLVDPDIRRIEAARVFGGRVLRGIPTDPAMSSKPATATSISTPSMTISTPPRLPE